MPCETIKQPERRWKRNYEKANYSEHSECKGTNLARKIHALAVKRHRADQALAAYPMQTHWKACSVYNEKATTV
jgi:hypothetical protein